MSKDPYQSQLESIAEVFTRNRVKFVVIGGQAEYIFGSPRVTFDVDLCYERSPENLQRLASTLKELDISLRGAPPGLPFVTDARTLGAGLNFTFNSKFGDLDLLGEVEPIGGFDQVSSKALTYQVGNFDLQVIDLDDLIRVKQHINRPKDRDSLYQLLAIKKIRAETGLR